MSTTTADAAAQASTPGFVTSLVLNAAVLGGELVVFTVVRRHFRAIYEPRSYIPSPSKRSPPLSPSLLGWPLAIWNADPARIQQVNGLDAYVFVRFLRMMCYMLLPMWIISWVVLMPTYSANTGVDPPKSGLDQFTFGNVGNNQQQRYAAPLVLAYLFTFWILYTVRNEMREFILLRQKHLVSPSHSSTAQANTVLLTGVPKKFLDEKVLAGLFHHLPGGARKIWLNRDLKDLPDMYNRRVKACKKLESAENALLEKALKLKRKADKAALKGKKHVREDSGGTLSSESKQPINAGGKDSADPEKELSLADRYVPRNMRPTHRLPPFAFLPFGIPFLGKKVDTIAWAREEILFTNVALREGRAALERDIVTEGTGEHETYPPLNSAFVLFNQQIAAHLASQALTHNEPYRMSVKHIEVAPEDVIWANLGLNPYEMKIRAAISLGLSIGLIIVWSFPVAFVGAISNVNHLCSYSWLSWICRLPSVVVGVISGILPPLGLAILMMMLPIVLRLLARFEGIPRYSGLELSLMTRYFLFLVVHGFLIVTLSSGLIAALPQLVQNPEQIPQILGTYLPAASTFFLTYITLQGLAGGGGGLLQVTSLVIYYLKLFILGSTPRSIWNIKYIMRDVAWGTLFPSMTLIAVITIAYSVISPIINGLSCFSFFIYYQVWKYLFLWQLNQEPSTDTGGLYFPLAIQHVFVGLYIEQICLAALFLLTSKGTPTAVPEGILMIVLIVITAGSHAILNNSYGPLINHLPLTLAHKSYGMPLAEEENKMDEEDDDSQSIGMKELKSSKADHFDVTDDKSNADGAARRADADVPNSEGRTELTSNKARISEGDDEATVAKQKAEANKERDNPFDGALDDGPTDFYHPAAVAPQQIVWIAQDPLGLGDAEVEANRAMGVDASNQDAEMDEKGHVEIFGQPPGAEEEDEEEV
ncbi:DUF221-domain-containing protein [Calocera viscosa TUFC12733]|uniref:DUF221-domain-containing protein n=1 Tax=Calocera viscosa (strain TUFC12733) TaxID=1330018 RepID=A0A167L6A2_CALVF|nr:DUF221-domain-containing protein [Calocera viscosa TUFC12733]